MQCIKCLDDIKHPMGQLLNKSGVCTGCLTHGEKNIIDWKFRHEKLNDRCYELTKKNNAKYDCVISLNADAEDYFIVEQALNIGLRPLLIYVNNYFGTDLSWQNLHNLETYFDLDLITINPNIHTYKEAIRTSLRKFNSIYWPYQALKTSHPVRLALEMKIPLILWGGYQAIEQTGKFSHDDMVEMTGWGRLQHDLFGITESDFFGTGSQISNKQKYNYYYPSIRKSKKIVGIYLSNYMRWDPWKQNHGIIKYGFKPEDTSGTFDQFERSGSSVFYQIHDALRFEKHGYLKVRDHLSREIRHGRILRKDAEEVYKNYLSQEINISPFFRWLGATDSGEKLFIKNRLPKFMEYNKSHKKISFNPKSRFIKHFFSTGEKIKNKFVLYQKGI